MGKKKENHRSRYVDQKAHFIGWVNGLEIEKTPIGRFFILLNAKFSIKNVIFLFLFSLFLSFTLFYQFNFSQNYQVNEVARSDYIAPFSIEIVDEIATEQKRKESEENVLFVFDYDPNVSTKTTQRIYNTFHTFRTYYRQFPWSANKSERVYNNKEFFKYKPEFDKLLEVVVPNYIFDWLIEKKFSSSIENQLIQLQEKWSSQKITDHPSKYIRNQSKAILRPIADSQALKASDDLGKEIVVDKSMIKDMSIKKNFPIELTNNSTDGKRQGTSKHRLSKKDQNYTSRLTHLLLTANVTPNKQETEARKKAARERVLPVVFSVKQGQKIIASREIVTPLQISVLKEINSFKNQRQETFITIMAAILFVVMILVFFSYLRRFTLNKVQVTLKDVSVMGLTALVVTLLTKTFVFITESAFLTNTSLDIPEYLFLYLAPVASGTMMVGLLITSGEVVWLFAMFLSLILGLMMNMNFPFALVTLVGSIAAARGVHSCKNRNDIYRAGVRTGLINALVILLVFSVSDSSYAGSNENLLWIALAGFVGGVFSSLITMMVVPLLESVFNYTTDIRLLELCNLNHPLLKELLVKAPGTYHHSIVVGSMIEASAEQIGANPLLGKVMGYYHDIGKMEHAHYFIENQKRGYNPHDNISPYMSKTVLIAHVKDGAEVGLKHNLGKPIIDGILQHHGTTLIEYFYKRALEYENENIDHVREEDFRYPGPKPQFCESGLLMIADSVEAAARSLADPTSVRLQNLVKNIIHKKFLDGQLDECNLTLRELSIIEKSCIRILLGIYHQRIDYPKKNGLGIADKGAKTIQEAHDKFKKLRGV